MFSRFHYPLKCPRTTSFAKAEVGGEAEIAALAAPATKSTTKFLSADLAASDRPELGILV